MYQGHNIHVDIPVKIFNSYVRLNKSGREPEFRTSRNPMQNTHENHLGTDIDPTGWIAAEEEEKEEGMRSARETLKKTFTEDSEGTSYA